MRISDWSSDVCSSDLLLRAELVARESQYLEPAILVIAVKLLEPLILRGEAAFRCGVDDQQHLTAIVGERLRVPARQLRRKIVKCHDIFSPKQGHPSNRRESTPRYAPRASAARGPS